MKKAFLLMDFKQMSGPNLLQKSTTILNSMTDNKSFPKPVPTLAVLGTAIKNFSNALALAKDGDRIKINDKDAQRAALITVLLQLMDYVTYTAGGDRSMLMSSGYTVNAATKTARSMGKIKGVKVILGENSGEIIVTLDKVKGADAYLFYYGPAPIVNDSWKVLPNGKLNQCTISGLERGKEYSIRVGVVGPKGKTVYSQVINIIVN
ncbi:MAG: hypothetical protein QM726_21580 [Chitinophagaceae bacterium]